MAVVSGASGRGVWGGILGGVDRSEPVGGYVQGVGILTDTFCGRGLGSGGGSSSRSVSALRGVGVLGGTVRDLVKT